MADQPSKELSTILIFFMTILLVGGFLWAFYQIYYLVTKKNQGVGVDGKQGKMPIMHEKLQNLVNWRSFYNIEYRLIKNSNTNYEMLVRFDWNKFQDTVLTLYQEKRIREFEAKKEAERKAEEAMGNHPFEQIVKVMDQTTAEQVIPSAVNAGELTPNQQSEELLMMRTISDKTEEFFFGSKPLDWGPEKLADLRMDEQEVQDLYRLLDMVRLNLDVQGVVRVDHRDRMINLEIPLYFVQKTPEFVHLRFDPDWAIRDTKSEALQSVKKLTRVTEVFIFNNRMVVFPENEPDRQIVIPLT